MATRGSKAALIGTDQRIRIVLAGQCADWIARHHRNFGRKSGNNVEIHQASIQFREWRAVLPSHPGVQRQSRADAPIVGEKGVIQGSAKVFVGIAECDGSRVRNTQQKIREIGAAWRRR